jgi:hypothetical protein
MQSVSKPTDSPKYASKSVNSQTICYGQREWMTNLWPPASSNLDRTLAIRIEEIM